MLSVVETIRTELCSDDPAPAELRQYEHELIAVLENDSLGALITSAMTSRKQGRIDDAISKITRANRTQLDAIEGIMQTLDAMFERPKKKVIFAKYRQISPFEMGLENADDVLDLVSGFNQKIHSCDTSQIARLHNLESARVEETEALNFFRERCRAGSAETEIEETEIKLRTIAAELEHTKSVILRAVISSTIDLLDRHGNRGVVSLENYQISGWLYQIVTSKTLTKAAIDVEVN